MIAEIPDFHKLLVETDWSQLSHAFGSAYPDTPTAISGLLSGNPDIVASSLGHLSGELLHQDTLYSATPPAALCVAGLLGCEKYHEALTPSWEIGKYPLRAKLLIWLSEVAYAVSNAMERNYWMWFRYSPVDDNSYFREVRAIRPRLFYGIVGCLNDSSLKVKEATLVAAAYLLEDKELASCRESMASSMRSILAVSTETTYRLLAVRVLLDWGADADSFDAEALSAVLEAYDQGE